MRVTYPQTPQDMFPVTYDWDAINVAVDGIFYTADRAMAIISAIARIEVAGIDAGAVTAIVRSAPSATAIASGTAIHSGTINLKGSAATNQVLTLTVLTLASGDSLGFDLTGIATSAAGTVTVMLARA